MTNVQRRLAMVQALIGPVMQLIEDNQEAQQEAQQVARRDRIARELYVRIVADYINRNEDPEEVPAQAIAQQALICADIFCDVEADDDQSFRETPALHVVPPLPTDPQKGKGS